jgi:gliding motility-associated-like protein
MPRISATPFCLFFLLFNYFAYTGLSQQPFYGHKFASGMIYSSINRSSSEKNRRSPQQVRTGAGSPTKSPSTSSHYVVTGSLILAVNSTGTTCGFSNGSFDVTASGGTAPYQYSENGYPYQNSGYFGEKAAGTYIVTAEDASGTTATVTVVLTNTYTSPVIAVQSYNDPTGCSNTNGSAVFSATGGTPPYEFNIDFGAYGNSNTFNNLTAGEYYFGVQDQNGCVSQTNLTMTSPCPIQVDGYSYSELICFPNTGEIDLIYVVGGTPPYKYSADGINYQTSGDLTGLSVGERTVYVKDASGLIKAMTFAIGYYCSLSVALVTTDATCGNSDGTITATGSSGTAPYTYSIDGINFQTSGLFSGLAPGPYTITIKDVSGITNYSDAIINGNCPAVLATATNATCGQADGSIQVTGQGGTTPYLFSIDGINFTPDNTFTGLSPGMYTLTVKDAKGFTASTSCNVASVCVTVSASPMDGTCGNSNGMIIATGSGGTLPYQYSINGTNFQSAGAFSGLAASSYTIIIRDATGLTNSTAVIVGNSGGPSLVHAEVSDASCGNNDGTITLDARGGLAPLSYSTDGINFQSNPGFGMLASGVYITSVKDANGCTASQSTTIPLHNTITANAGTGGTICQGGSITLSASTNADTFSWGSAPGLSDVHLLDPVVSPATKTKYYFTGISGACQATDSVTIYVIPAPIADAGSDVTTCYGKDATLHGSGGIKYQWAPSLYLSNPNIEDPDVQDPVHSVTYSLAVTDANGCRSLTPASVSINVTPPAAIFLGNDTSIAIGQPLILHVIDINSSGFTNFLWTPADGLDNPSNPDPAFVPDNSGTYSYTVTAYTPNGCEAKGQITLSVYQQADIYVPNAFTPNGDGHNDVLRAIPVGIKEFKYFIIYDRWGQQVFRTTDPGIGWDGRTNRKAESGSTFVWAVAGIDYRGRSVERKGTVILIR